MSLIFIGVGIGGIGYFRVRVCRFCGLLARLSWCSLGLGVYILLCRC